MRTFPIIIIIIKKLPIPVQPVLEMNRETKINLGTEAQSWQEVCTSVAL